LFRGEKIHDAGEVAEVKLIVFGRSMLGKTKFDSDSAEYSWINMHVLDNKAAVSEFLAARQDGHIHPDEESIFPKNHGIRDFSKKVGIVLLDFASAQIEEPKKLIEAEKIRNSFDGFEIENNEENIKKQKKEKQKAYFQAKFEAFKTLEKQMYREFYTKQRFILRSWPQKELDTLERSQEEERGLEFFQKMRDYYEKGEQLKEPPLGVHWSIASILKELGKRYKSDSSEEVEKVLPVIRSRNPRKKKSKKFESECALEKGHFSSKTTTAASLHLTEDEMTRNNTPSKSRQTMKKRKPEIFVAGESQAFKFQRFDQADKEGRLLLKSTPKPGAERVREYRKKLCHPDNIEKLNAFRAKEAARKKEFRKKRDRQLLSKEALEELRAKNAKDRKRQRAAKKTAQTLASDPADEN
jgi:hypothetical protein